MVKEKVRVKCPHCNHKYATGAKTILVTCSSCGVKFNIKENKIREEEK